MAYATREQYDVRFPGRTASDATCDAKLEAASIAIDSELEGAGIDTESYGAQYADRLAEVCCSVANRIMPADHGIPQGATSASMTAVGFSESISFKTPYGSPSLVKSERRMLGIGGKIGVARPSYGVLEPRDA